MTDKMTPAQRHYCMSRIHGKSTKPELKVRQWLWRHGYRYRLNVKSVPGKPDIVMRRYRTAIFVNGCFWHGHDDCDKFKIPQTNREFWVNKIKSNQERDKKNYQVLHDNGWQVVVIWECQLTPKRIEETMLRVELMLNEYFLALHQPKVVPYDFQETPAAMAAEELSSGQK
ncbi:MAG: DNA mismatch endonuclease Vsr [Bacteroidales bacterium]|nr:DNA mismatch endonuclease Vsr [Bacteroidales bacterium]